MLARLDGQLLLLFHREGCLGIRNQRRRVLSTPPLRIWVKHFAYRSHEQIDKRLMSRRGAIDAQTCFSHEAIEYWSDAVPAIKNTRSGFASPDKKFAGTTWRERVVPSSS